MAYDKCVQDSKVEVIQFMTQADANIAGNVHGGVIMKLIDNTAGIVAMRHCGTNAVTASLDRLDFHSPVFVGDILHVKASVNLVGRTSMEIGVRVEAEDYKAGCLRHTASAYLTFISLDENGKPSPVPPISIVTDEDRRRNEEAKERRRIRLEEKEREKKRHGKK